MALLFACSCCLGMGGDALLGYLPQGFEGCGNAAEGPARSARTSLSDVRIGQRRVGERLLRFSFGLRGCR